MKLEPAARRSATRRAPSPIMTAAGVSAGVLILMLIAAALVAPPGATGAAKRPAAAVATKKATVGVDRKVRLVVRCNRTGIACRGRVELRLAGEKRRVARTAFRVRAGARKTITLRLSQAAYARLVAVGSARVLATAATRRSRAKAKRRTRTVLLAASPASGGSPPPSPPPTDSDPAADRARADRIALKLSDLPSGWEKSTGGLGAGSSCTVPDSSELSGRHPFDRFETGLATSAGSDVSIMKTQAAAARAYDVVPGVVNQCFTSLVGSTIDGAKLNGSTARSLGPLGVGDRASAFRIELDLAVGFLRVTLVVDAVYIQSGRAFAALFFSELDSPFDPRLRDQLAGTVAARMAL